MESPTQDCWNWPLWWRWTLATAGGELAGFAVPAAVGVLVARAVEGMEGGFPVLALFVAAVLAGLVEGASLGLAQWLVLRRYVRGISRRDWVLYTAVAAGVAYILGMTPSTLYDLVAPSNAVMVTITVPLGLLLLPSIGLAQWWVLRRHVQRAGRWIWANALAWLGGLAAPFVGMALVPDESPAAVFIVVGVSSGLLMGVLVGAITGVALVRLLQRDPGSS